MIPRVHGTVGTPLKLRGNAYDFGHAIAAIQFSLDRGEHWTTYPTADTNDYQNLSWEFDYTPDQAGFFVLYVRSVNDAGEASPEAAHVELEITEGV